MGGMKSTKATIGPTVHQLNRINILADWLDLTRLEVLEIAIEGIDKDQVEGREFTSYQSLSTGEAGELVKELEARKEWELAQRRGNVRKGVGV
jgi:hypothetical protein